MPRIPRRWKGEEETAPPEEQSSDPLTSPDGTTAPAPGAPTSGDPLASPPSEPADASAAEAAAPAADASGSAEPAAAASGLPEFNWPAPTPPADATAAQEPATDVASPAASAPAGEPAADAPTTVDAPTTAFPAAEAAAAEASATESHSAVDAPGEQPTVAAAPVAVTSGDPLGGVTPARAPEGEQAAPQGETVVVEEEAPADARPRFRQRTRMRRRLRYLRRLRELAFRDLGGLVFDLHRFGRERSDLVAAKLEALSNIDRELRTLQEALGQRQEFTDLREAGIAACPRCGTLHDTDANFCPGCGTSLRTAIVRDAAPVTVTPAVEEPAAPTEPATPAATPAATEQQPTTTSS